jgi:hypothetical protein
MQLRTAVTGVMSSKSFCIVYQSDLFIVIMSSQFPYHMDYMKHVCKRNCGNGEEFKTQYKLSFHKKVVKYPDNGGLNE